MAFAIYRRMLQFAAGPNQSEFLACAEHAPKLRAGEFSGVFFGRAKEPLRPVDPEEEWSCDYCRQGGE